MRRNLDAPAEKPKVIVFSQFWIHINLVRTHLLNRGINFATLKVDLPASEKIQALERFQVQPLENYKSTQLPFRLLDAPWQCKTEASISKLRLHLLEIYHKQAKHMSVLSQLFYWSKLKCLSTQSSAVIDMHRPVSTFVQTGWIRGQSYSMAVIDQIGSASKGYQ